MKYCLDCKKPKSQKGNYCKKCGYKHRIRLKGLKYIKHKDNPTSFKKGQIPWNIGTKGLIKPNKGSFKSGEHRSLSTEFTSNTSSGEKNYNWKGDNVGYSSLHTRIHRRFGKAVICSRCGSKKNVHWSNVSGDYRSDFNDWEQLCQFCHFSKDRKELKEGKRKRIIDVFKNMRRDGV